MFCNACGSKLSKEDKKCRACGAPADQGETCGGFWGLVGEKPTVTYLPPVPPAAPVKKPDPAGSARVQTPPAQPAPAKKSSMKLWYGLVAALALLLAVQTIRIGVLNGELKNQESLARTYREWYTQASQENELLNEQLDSVSGELQTLSDDVAQIKEILEPTETTEPQEPEETVPEDTRVPGESEASQETAATEENTTPESQPEETVEETN